MPNLCFTVEDTQATHFSHNNALIITLDVANFTVQRLFVDNGCSVNILFWMALKVMRIGQLELEKSNSTLIMFNRKETRSSGSIKLPITTNVVMQLTLFVMMDSLSAYNTILGRPWIHVRKVVLSALHLKIKFFTLSEIQEVIRDQTLAQDCYFNTLKVKRKHEE